MTFVDKNPEADDEDAPPLQDESKWEHRRIQNVVWGRRCGWTVKSVIIDDDSGDIETYVIDALLLQMIRDSPSNSRQIRSKIPTTPDNNNSTPPPSSQISDSDSEAGQVETI